MTRSQSQAKSDLLITGTEAGRIGERIRRIRGAASQREFASRLGISREQLSRIESGAQVPGTETLRRLGELEGVSLDFVVLGRPAVAARGAAEPGWPSALASLLQGTGLRWPATAGDRRAERAWHALPEANREELRNVVRRIALVAAAIDAALPPKAAKPVLEALSAALGGVVVGRLLDRRRRGSLS